MPLEDGADYAVETKVASGFKLDPSPIYFEVKDGKTVHKTVENEEFSGIIIHKICSESGEGLYGAKFILYDSGKNPIAEGMSDQDGFVYFDDLISEGKGRFYLRELESPEGYEAPDNQYKTVYVQAGETIEIEWENTPVTGQIQIYKYVAEYNEITGTAPGTPLQGAVYEIEMPAAARLWTTSPPIPEALPRPSPCL